MGNNNFSFNPPIGKTRPLKVISPVILHFVDWNFSNVIIEVTIPIPADGPSLGVAPSGTQYENLFYQKLEE